jgi:MFS family permease
VFAQASGAALLFGIAVLAPALRARYHLSLSEVGVLLAASNFGSIPALLPWGLLADRIGERLVIAIGLFGAAAAVAGMAVGPSFVLLVILLVLAGALGVSVNVASGRAVMHWFGAEQRGLAFGLRQTAIPLGGVLASLLLPPIVTADGLRAGFAVLAAFCFAAATAGLIWMREGPETSEGVTLTDVRHPLGDARMWRLSWGSCLLLAIPVTVGGFIVLFLHSQRGLSTAAAAGIFAIGQVLGGAGRIGFGSWSDRLGTRVRPMRWIGVALALAVAGAAALVDAPLGLLLPALVVAVGLGMSWNGLSFTAAAELAGHARSGAAIGFQQTSLSLTAAALPPLFAAAVAATSWQAGFAIVAVCPLAAAFVLKGLRV